MVTGKVSNDPVTRVIPPSYLDAEQVDRWAQIAAGNLPDGEGVPGMMTDEQLAEAEAEQLREAEAWGHARDEEIREQAEAEAGSLAAEAERVADDLSIPAQVRHRQAARLEEQAAEVVAEAQREIARTADMVREQRAEARAELHAQVQAAEGAAAERVAELRAGLAGEIEAAVNARYYSTGGATFDLEEFELV